MPAENVSVAVMAGGKSSRMGSIKAFMPFLGRPMIEHVIDRVAGLGNEILIVTNDPDPYSYLGLPMVGDVYEDCGPLGGIHSALYHGKYQYLLVVACDMPWLERGLLDHMISLRETADVIVPRWGKFPEPLHALYSKSCLEPVESSLEAGILKVISFYGRLTVRFLDREEIERFDPEGRSFVNVNTPGDLADAESSPQSGSS
ncbi:MAG: molybdenum cofactor guanylyltransferase [Candidatus Promineifilaceae bacterium]